MEEPTLHVFVPVHNEERYVAATLKSVQDASEYYQKQGRVIKVTVSNNSSSDGSRRIIMEFADRNPSWEIRETQRILSGDEHFNDLIQSCLTKHICIVGGHDMISQKYFYELELCLTDNQDASLAFCKEFIDETGLGENVQGVSFRYCFSSDEKQRFWQSIFYLGNATCIQGLIDTRKLQSIVAHESKVSDLVWLHGLLRYGNFVYSEDAAYIRTNPIRSMGNTNTKKMKLTSERTAMDLSLLRAWTPSESTLLERRLARLLIKLKYSSHSGVVILFRIGRIISRKKIPPASKRREISGFSVPILEVL